MAKSPTSNPVFIRGKQQTQRQQQVAQEVRWVLSQFFLKEDLPSGSLPSPITITDILMSPDLQLATVYFVTLGGEHQTESLAILKEFAPYIRHHLGKNVHLRYTPNLRFILDESFEIASRLSQKLTPESDA